MLTELSRPKGGGRGKHTERRRETLGRRTGGPKRPEEAGHCGKGPRFRRVPLKWRPLHQPCPRGLSLLGILGPRGTRVGCGRPGTAAPPERAELGTGRLGPAAPLGPREQSLARMATPDQKSPNVLLQNLCCRILGKSEGSGVGPVGSGSKARSGGCFPSVQLRGVQGSGGVVAGRPLDSAAGQ